MTVNMVPLDSTKHKDLYINVDQSYSHVSGQNMTPLVAAEFLSASTNFPIVFVKQQETGGFKAVALFGFSSGENLIFNKGKVLTNYIPINIRRYPFAAGGESAQDNQIVLCLDESSKLLNEKEGIRIFNDDGTASEATQQVGNLISDLLAKDEATGYFIDFLVENDLLQATELTVNLGDEGGHKINGIYKVDEEALNNLSDTTVLEIYKRKYFPAIYAHLASLSQINRLLQLKAEFTAS